MLFSMMLVGYFVWKREWMNETSYAHLSKIVVNICNPMLVVAGVLGKDKADAGALLLQDILLVILCYGLLTILGVIFSIVLNPKKSHKKVYRLMTIFPNAGFMGIPVISSIYGEDSVIYILFYMLAYNIILYTYGMVLARQAGEDNGNVTEGKISFTANLKKMFNPGVIGSIAAILIFAFQVHIPDAAASFCKYFGDATIPLSMMLIGISIAKVELKSVFSDWRLYVYTLLRMLVIPILAIVILKPILPVDEMVFGVFALEFAMPIGTILTLVAEENGADSTCCTNGIILTTLASIITIPLVSMFL